MISLRSARNAAAGAVGAGALAGAMLFGGTPAAQAAPAPAPSTGFASAGPHGPDAIIPDRGGWGGGGRGGGWGRGGGGRGGWGGGPRRRLGPAAGRLGPWRLGPRRWRGAGGTGWNPWW